jgi:hypothetical protein
MAPAGGRKTPDSEANPRACGDGVAGTPSGREILRRQPAVAMMEAADKGRLKDSAQVGTVHRSRFRGVLVQGEVRPDVVVVGKVVLQQPTQMGLVEHDHMVEALAA